MAVDEFAGNGAEMQVHTPGPWHVILDGEEDDGHSAVRVQFAGQDGEDADVAEVSYGAPNSRSELLANAHLIAAAPELLDALRLAPDVHAESCALSPRDFDAKCTCWVGLKRAALRKAGGNANG